jgi:hypothetical protein
MTLYVEWLNSIIKQTGEYRDQGELDLVLFKNHLNLLVEEIERSPEYGEQLSKCSD